MSDEIEAAVSFLRQKIGAAPRLALVLGSGLGGLAEEVEDPLTIPYSRISGFSVSTAPGHAGALVCGKLSGRKVIVMQGRFHFYEGYPLERIVFPLRVFRALGVERLLLTNAAGGVNPGFSPGDFMVIRDHINMTGWNPCIGQNDERLGPRFFDMSRAYSPALRGLAHRFKRLPCAAVGHCSNFETPLKRRFAASINSSRANSSSELPQILCAILSITIG